MTATRPKAGLHMMLCVAHKPLRRSQVTSPHIDSLRDNLMKTKILISQPGGTYVIRPATAYSEDKGVRASGLKLAIAAALVLSLAAPIGLRFWRRGSMAASPTWTYVQSAYTGGCSGTTCAVPLAATTAGSVLVAGDIGSECCWTHDIQCNWWRGNVDSMSCVRVFGDRISAVFSGSGL